MAVRDAFHVLDLGLADSRVRLGPRSGQSSGTIVGMAFVVARPNGRFEIRESQHTSRGPRARTLTGFRVLSDAVLAEAARRASRPFDVQAVLRSSRRAGAPVELAPTTTQDVNAARRAFVEASLRMAQATARPRSNTAKRDPGEALIELLAFADEVRQGQAARSPSPLAFPPLALLAREQGRIGAGGRAVSVQSGG